MKQYTVCALICAAGQGLRAGFQKNKLLTPFMGATALEKTLSAFDFPAIDEIVVAASETDLAEITALCEKFPRTNVVLGGKTRIHSVHAALQTVKSDIVLIHDGARPFVTREVIEGCIQSVKTHGSGICAVLCTDTIAYVLDGKVAHTPKRSNMAIIQTPQGFFTENIRFAYDRAIATDRTDFTDDSSVFLNFCGEPHICKGACENSKLTFDEDFKAVERVGFGVDTHAFGKEQNYIVLAGVKIPSQSGLLAHSDGDVLVHAVMDALLSAAGLKDIGHYFPDSDEKWKDANSMEMLKLVHGMLLDENLRVQNLSIAIQAERPKLAPYIDEMKNALSSVLKIDPTKIGITAGTNEGLGYIGEGKGITVTAVTLLEKHY